MKKYVAYSFLFLMFMAVFSSCKKVYECKCYYANGKETTETVKYRGKDADDACASLDDDYTKKTCVAKY